MAGCVIPTLLSVLVFSFKSILLPAAAHFPFAVDLFTVRGREKEVSKKGCDEDVGRRKG